MATDRDRHPQPTGKQVEETADRLRKAAEREANSGSAPANRQEREQADSDSAAATPVLIDRELSKGHSEPEPEDPRH